MSRPLLVTDCDEVLLHMVRHFRAWLDEAHDIEFPLNSNPFASMQRRGAAEPLPDDEKWRYLTLFFDTEMHRQNVVPGAVEALRPLAAVDDEPRLAQHAQVLRDRGTRDLELGGDLSGTELPARDELENAPAVRLGERFDGGFHECVI